MRKDSKIGAMGIWAVIVSLLLGWYGVSGFDSSMAWAKESMDDPNWKGYTRVSGVSGNVNSIGSDTLNNLMTLWAEGFRKQYPNVKIQIEGKGSSTAPPALIEATAQLGPMSRKMKGKEMDAFEAKFGYKPTAFPVAIDALAVYVNKDNPIPGMSVAQVETTPLSGRATRYADADPTRRSTALQRPEPVALCDIASARIEYWFEL